MPKRDLNVLETNPLVQKVMSERVTEVVGIHPFLDSSLFTKKLEEVPHIDSLDWLSQILFGDTAEDRRVSLTVDPKRLSLEHPQVEIHLSL